MIPESVLEEVYKTYPRKLGKSPGLKKAKKEIKKTSDLENLKTAIQNYRSHLERENIEPKFTMHFSTFMSQWRDWICPEHETQALSISDVLRGCK